MEDSLAVPQKAKQSYYMAQQLHSYIYTHTRNKNITIQKFVHKLCIAALFIIAKNVETT